MKNLYLGDTILTSDSEWAGADGTHANRTAIYLGDNGDGTAWIMRTSTSGPRNGRAPKPGHLRISPDGAIRNGGPKWGNSLNSTCDLIADHRGITSLPWSQIICHLGKLNDAQSDWIEDRLDALGL